MLVIIAFIYVFFRIYVFAKIFFLLTMTYYYPESYPLTLLTWWIYFLVFDIWIDTMLNKRKNTEEKNDENM
jgi:hypothetical protein